MSKKKYTPRFLRYIYIIAAVLMVGSILRSVVISTKQVHNKRTIVTDITAVDALADLNSDWMMLHEDGTQEKIALPCSIPADEESVTIIRDVSGMLHEGDVICFDNNRQGVVVEADGEVVYETNTTELRKQVVFTDYQMVAIPEPEKTDTLSLKFIHLIGDHFELPQITYGSYYSAQNEIIRSEFVTIVILIMLVVLLVGVGLILIYCKWNGIVDSRIEDLWVFIFTAIIWGFTDSYIPVLTDIPQEVLGVLCYLTIMALPLPMCHFAWLSCNKNYKAFQIVSLAGTVNLLLQILLSSFGVFQLQNTFFSAHILIVAVVITSLVYIYKSRKDQKGKDMDILYGSMIVLVVVAITSMTLYWARGGEYYRISMLAGVLFFSALLICYVIVHYLRKMQENQLKLSEIKIHERLSFFDELTGLPNRRAFEGKLKEVEANREGLQDAVLMMMDVNGLKIVNDRYGHSAGDDLIVAAAQAISETYGEKGICFRIGGDEFVVIMEDFSIPLSVYDRLFEMNIARKNSESAWKLSIAKGTSHLVQATGRRLSISDWKQEADVNMYRDKLSNSEQQGRDRAKDFLDIINCIISTVEAKDTYTAAHSDRVRELSCRIARRLGVSDSTYRNLEAAAFLHDIGKVGIPDYILLKTGRLDDEEYEIIKKHSSIGAGIIGRAKGMQEISSIVLYHHERWDGRGYPEGLKQEEIPLESRIIALADSIDAMTSKRVYRDCMPLDECRKEIEKNAGIMYDPAITQIVLQNWKDIVDIVMLHPKRLLNTR